MINKVLMIKCYEAENSMDEPVTESIYNCPTMQNTNAKGCLKYTDFIKKTVVRACDYGRCMVSSAHNGEKK